MPTPIGQVFNDLALKAGIAVDNPALKLLLASPELATIQVPDELITGIDNGLLSIEAAKNNHPEIKKVYTAAAYDGMDKHLIQILGSDTFDAADLEEIKNEKSTSKKYELAIAKLKEAKGKANGADKDAINAQIAAAHEAARLAKLEVESLKTNHQNEIQNIRKTAAVKAMFGNYKTIYDDLPADIRTATMEAIINKALQDKNAEFKADEHGNLQLLAKDGSNVFGENHVQLTTPSFLDKTFAPILKVSGPPKPAAAQPRQQNAAPAPGEAFNGATTDFIKSHTEQVLADMAATPANMM